MVPTVHFPYVCKYHRTYCTLYICLEIPRGILCAPHMFGSIRRGRLCAMPCSGPPVITHPELLYIVNKIGGAGAKWTLRLFLSFVMIISHIAYNMFKINIQYYHHPNEKQLENKLILKLDVFKKLKLSMSDTHRFECRIK